MDRIATSDRYAALLSNLQAAESRAALAQQQAASGKVGQDLKAYAGKAETLTATRSVQARLTTYADSGQALAARLSLQNQALGQVSDAADTAKQAVLKALAAGHASGLLTTLQGSLSQAAGALNTQADGRNLFGGGNETQAPVTASSLSDLTAAPSAAGVFKDGGLNRADRLDDQTTVQTGFRASDVGGPLASALREVQAYSEGPNGPLSGHLSQAQQDFLTGVVKDFTAAASNAVDQVAANGALQARVEASNTALLDRQTAIKGVLSGLTDVDEGEVATRLALAQTAVQTSAQVFATLKGSSLLNVLSSGA